MKKANCVIAGSINIIDDFELANTPKHAKITTEYRMVLVIEFDNENDIRKAINSGKVEFTVFKGINK